MNRILGIDPGTTTMGYGVVEGEGDGLSLVNYGVLTVSPSVPMTERLHHLYLRLLEVISHYQPIARPISGTYSP